MEKYYFLVMVLVKDVSRVKAGNNTGERPE